MSSTQGFKRYVRIFLSLLKTSAIADFEYRMNILVKVFTDILWYTAQISVFEVLYSFTDTIGGWDIHAIRIFLAILFFSDSIYMLLFHENLDRFSDRVRKGDLDLLLAKPVNSQFMMSLYKMNTAYFINIFFTLLWLIYSIQKMSTPFSTSQALLLGIAVLCSVIIVYSLRFFFSATAVIFGRADYIIYVWYQFYRLSTRPDMIYPSWIRYPILFVIPLGFIASVPARIVLFSEQWYLALGSIIFASLFLYLSSRFWRFVLTKYSSASS